MTPTEIANTYIKIRYGATREYDLIEQVVYKLKIVSGVLRSRIPDTIMLN